MICIKSLLLLKCLNFLHPTLIVQTAIDVSAFEDNVVIVGEGIDLLVILSELAPTIENIYFLKQEKEKPVKKCILLINGLMQRMVGLNLKL